MSFKYTVTAHLSMPTAVRLELMGFRIDDPFENTVDGLLTIIEEQKCDIREANKIIDDTYKSLG